MFLGNGATAVATWVYQQTVAVKPHTSYSLSFWAANVDPTSNSVNSGLAILQLFAGNLQLGKPIVVSLTAGEWVNQTATWDAGESTSVVLSIMDMNATPSNNDFALDDLSFVGCE